MLSASMMLTGFLPGNISTRYYAYADTPSLTINSDVAEEYQRHMWTHKLLPSNFDYEGYTIRKNRVEQLTSFINSKRAL